MADYYSRQHDWVRNVIHGEKYKERYSGDAFWFRGDVLFKGDTAVLRLLKTLDGKWIALRQIEHFAQLFDDGKKDWAVVPRGNQIKMLTFHSIGVHHPYEGGKLEGDELHMFMHQQMQGRLDEVLEAVKAVSIVTLHEYSGTHFITMAETYEREHEEYRMALSTDVPPIKLESPTIRRVIENRLAKYLDPKAVEARGRSAARKIAKKALGL